MKFGKYLGLAACVAMLAACSVTSTDQGTKPAEAKGGLFGLSKTENIVVENPKAFTSKQVVIGSFKVAFLEEKKGSNKASGGLLGGGSGGKSSAKMTLNGVTPELMQTITDQAYADFVAQLQSNGYTVVDRGGLLADADFAKASKQASPVKEEASFFGSSTDVTYVAPTGFNDLHFFLGEYGKTSGFGWSNPSMAVTKYAQASGVPVISVAYTVDFANTGGHAGITTSSLKVGQGISVAPGSGITYIGGAGGGTFGANPNGSVKLGQAVSSDAQFGEVINTSTTAGVAVETAVNVMSAVLGGGSNQSRSFEINADPAQYQQVVNTVLQQANASLVSKMAAAQ